MCGTVGDELLAENKGVIFQLIQDNERFTGYQDLEARLARSASAGKKEG